MLAGGYVVNVLKPGQPTSSTSAPPGTAATATATATALILKLSVASRDNEANRQILLSIVHKSCRSLGLSDCQTRKGKKKTFIYLFK